jgi:hypothetical protein
MELEFGDGTTISNQQNPTHTYATYYLYAELAECESQTIIIELTENESTVQAALVLGGHSILGEPESIIDIEAGVIYLNPVIEDVRIRVKLNNPSELTIELYNLTGQMISQHRQSYNSVETIITVPTARLNNGVYTLKLYTRDRLLISTTVSYSSSG